MSWNHWMRQLHRWLSIAFTLTVVMCFVNLTRDEPAQWIFYVPLLPLALLSFTGLYLFVLPYVLQWRLARRPGTR